MPAQLKKNFIGLVSDQIEEQRVVESLAKSNRVLRRPDDPVRSFAGPHIGMQNEIAGLRRRSAAHALPAD
jgi:hypothetical protein